jgi:hypothetical protein
MKTQTQEEIEKLRSYEKEYVIICLIFSIIVPLYLSIFIPQYFGWIWLMITPFPIVRAIVGYFGWNVLEIKGMIQKIETVKTGNTGTVGYGSPTGDSYTQTSGPVIKSYVIIQENGKRVKVDAHYGYNDFLWGKQVGFEIECTVIVTLYRLLIYKLGL